MGHLYVNKYGKAVDVENYNYDIIGKIYPDEAFAWQRSDDRNPYQFGVIKFRNSSGQIATGYLFVDGFAGLLSSWAEYPVATNDFWDYSTNTYRKFNIYSVRRSTTIYKPDGTSVVGTVSAGGQVAVYQGYAGDSGSSNPDWMEVSYWRNSTSGSWNAVAVATNYDTTYGFAPIGLNHGSTKSTLSIYGNW